MIELATYDGITSHTEAETHHPGALKVGDRWPSLRQHDVKLLNFFGHSGLVCGGRLCPPESVETN